MLSDFLFLVLSYGDSVSLQFLKCKVQFQKICSVKVYKWVNFSQNQKGFGCTGAAVLLILSPKELISQKTRQSSLAITATVSAISQPYSHTSL